jgi:hypothetical protein
LIQSIIKQQGTNRPFAIVVVYYRPLFQPETTRPTRVRNITAAHFENRTKRIAGCNNL